MRVQRAGRVLVVTLVLAAAACGGESSQAAKPRPVAPPTVVTTTSRDASLPCGGTATIRAAVRTSTVAGLDSNPAQYLVADVSLSRSDTTWARFDTLPAPGQESSYQGGFGLAHCDGTSWVVTDFGTSEVGCPGGTVPPPPPAVRADLGIDCP